MPTVEERRSHFTEVGMFHRSSCARLSRTSAALPKSFCATCSRRHFRLRHSFDDRPQAHPATRSVHPAAITGCDVSLETIAVPPGINLAVRNPGAVSQLIFIFGVALTTIGTLVCLILIHWFPNSRFTRSATRLLRWTRAVTALRCNELRILIPFRRRLPARG
jgi:hypothetical protein